MARTGSPGDNGAYRDVPPRARAYAPAGPVPTRREPAPRRASSPRHILGLFAVVAVFALVGLTLWRPLYVVIAVPVIAVLILVIRSAVPMPAPARVPTGATGPIPVVRPRAPRETASAPGRYSDRPPYDQEADASRAAPARRRPAPPRGDATEVLRPPGPARPPAEPYDSPATEVWPRHRPAPAPGGAGIPPRAAAAAGEYHPGAAGDPSHAEPGHHAEQGPDEYGYGEFGDQDQYGRGERRRVQRSGETTRWWRRPDWADDEDDDDPEPNEDTIHTMAIDLRNYLDDTGSFRMP